MTDSVGPAMPLEFSDPVSLEDCPPGVFAFNGGLGFKTEYRAMEVIGPTEIPGDQVRWKVGRWPEAYVLESGEFFWGGAKTNAERAALMVRPALLSSRAGKGSEVGSFQARVAPWMEACFGAEISGDILERGDRLLEEVLELLQTQDYPPDRVPLLVDYVFNRPVGEPAQEVGGVMVCVAALCLARGLDMHEAAETELARVWTKVEQIRLKQKTKPKGSALPVPSPTADRERIAELEAALRKIVEVGTSERTERCGDPYAEDGWRSWTEVSEEAEIASGALNPPTSEGDE